MKKLLLFLLFCSVFIVLAACGSSDDDTASGEGEDSSESGESGETSDSVLAELQEAGTVTVGFANEKPYAYQEDGELKGAAVDIAKAVFAELGIDGMESQLADFGQLIPGLKAGKFDVITAGMAINPDRCENAAFGEPEMKYGEGLIVQKGNPLGLESYTDIADNPDVTVSVMAGATENEFLKTEGVNPDQIQSAPDIPATFSAVESGRADATTGTEMTIKMALESADTDQLEFVESFEQPDVEGVPSYGAAAFHLDNDELREAYNEKLAELKEDGTVAELLEKNGFSEEMNMVEAEVTTEKVCNGEF
ncbi:ectoine/hydroxyectoine ABC transporter substrate-binding protein EhuB [Virgibacillus profundi]|uniref:Ectoine/hydroxyectoine ABC transporter substrate-binding protein EhuB n=1 Tax=Virgibacillus profundi TaxID=2024555 RepID=A0A2A2IHJ5_9BACI|nr:ectoine/hydroxyectoine ABC transporter substrate-binding protein EhuB [Virgibacillus profundi]PAV30848.1 ectoine/hydroxyectoine ABC transporter substrate-binding protein EhuB [Virgibacillus profundi]PXY55031.1 ectoine/hydroxyectoine ABC transporter substrate-binding protein EhuB [Virgibacillus profundi]